MLRAGASLAVRLAMTVARTPSTDNNVINAAAGDGTPSPSISSYATEGGSVPIYSMLHGRIQRRNWVVRNPHWCDLCSEPIGQWVNHIGRKDHALMDFHYTNMVEWPRRWNPEELLKAFQESLGVDSIEPFHRLFSVEDQYNRNEVYAMLAKLEEAGMLYFGETRDTYLHIMVGGLRGMDHQGALVLHECLFAPFARLYPEAHIQDYSNLVDFITCSYNMETVYDMCGMFTLDKVALRSQLGPSSPAAMGLGGIATSSSASFGYKNECAVASPSPSAAATAATTVLSSRQAQMQSAKAERERENMEDEAFSRKATFVRQVLGQLRWLLMPDQVHPAGYTFPEHVITLGELCLKALVVQIVAARVVEYQVRIEPVWHNCGFERRKLNVAAVASKSADVTPTLFSYSHRPVPPKIGEFYSNHSSMLDDYVAKRLTRKGLPVPEAFQPSSKCRAAA
ncbi:putative mitochondrial KREPB7 (KREPB7) [Leptomonas pyrrhocoris]|uniref:Putative mitochondrial KREPB7 (KREPB7) n=1 Tax=Leptomonas pyrrhocoris TaxID=157538 RepID=A0A0M9FSB0_LEPPY|nr:putative mitochondrial KREPB7 (KREPB7) [Leptomonas pyrrhocoris]KPA75070.1 putative mitochondrial KREPB7 (KREPB7) [Leptomonas pyrrhocoris]|eukprot:XP_015653509.1 putative mitochondrial KREPB7 (KREPB7) [Leptomonas pyrrhocoris]